MLSEPRPKGRWEGPGINFGLQTEDAWTTLQLNELNPSPAVDRCDALFASPTHDIPAADESIPRTVSGRPKNPSFNEYQWAGSSIDERLLDNRDPTARGGDEEGGDRQAGLEGP